ncbi:hypothetical protein ACFOEX_08890 [Camelimonas abortus]|uniref:Uncharacterized protein n=2 Tax=Camelimonas abortus TaxID=1017184 RepID=A0ABV7LFD1_9HYPH
MSPHSGRQGAARVAVAAAVPAARGVLALALAAAASLAVTLAAAPARAEEGELAKNLLGKLGVIDEDREPISYHERPPLALPPASLKNLPPPRQPAARRAGQWPDDADLQRRRREAAERQKPVPFPSDNQVREGARLSVYELERISRKPRHSAENSEPRKVLGDGREATWVDPDKLRATASSGDGRKLDPGYEPERRSLVEPPGGYRKPAAGAPLRATPTAPLPIKRDNAPERDFLQRQED